MKILAKILRIIFIIFLALTAAFNILGGAGTTCAAFLTEQFPSMMALMAYRWLYQIFVVITVAIGLAGVATFIALIRGGPKVFRNALIVLVAGALVGYIHMYMSDMLRGKSAPANMVFYFNLITLVIALILTIPGLRQHVNFSKKEKKGGTGMAAGMAAFLAGVVTLSTPMWVGATHVYQGENWVSILELPILLVGIALVVGGLGYLVRIAIGNSASQLIDEAVTISS